MATAVKVAVFSGDRLTKEVYEFDSCGRTLEYSGYMVYRRSHTDEPWGDRWPSGLSQEEWEAREEDRGVRHHWADVDDAYHAYRMRFNPVMSVPVGGKAGLFARAGGRAGHNLAKDRPLPKGLAAKARAKFVKSVRVA